jgi:hypothetical protein
MSKRNYIFISFGDEGPLLQAVKKLRDNNEIINDVLTPFPIHGLDEAMSIERSRIPVVGFIFGALGAIIAFGFQAWVFTVSYPLIIGGKPFFSVPTFVPITFEVTVLFAGLAMVAALLVRSRLKPDIDFETEEARITDDRFVILVNAPDQENSLTRVRSLLSGIQTVEIR